MEEADSDEHERPYVNQTNHGVLLVKQLVPLYTEPALRSGGGIGFTAVLFTWQRVTQKRCDTVQKMHHPLLKVVRCSIR